MRPPIDLPPTNTARGAWTQLAHGGVDDCPERPLEHRRPVGHLLLLRKVGEVERHHADPVGREPFGVAPHERAGLPGAGAVREDERQLGLSTLSGIGKGRQ